MPPPATSPRSMAEEAAEIARRLKRPEPSSPVSLPAPSDINAAQVSMSMADEAQLIRKQLTRYQPAPPAPPPEPSTFDRAKGYVSDLASSVYDHFASPEAAPEPPTRQGEPRFVTAPGPEGTVTMTAADDGGSSPRPVDQDQKYIQDLLRTAATDKRRVRDVLTVLEDRVGRDEAVRLVREAQLSGAAGRGDAGAQQALDATEAPIPPEDYPGPTAAVVQQTLLPVARNLVGPASRAANLVLGENSPEMLRDVAEGIPAAEQLLAETPSRGPIEAGLRLAGGVGGEVGSLYLPGFVGKTSNLAVSILNPQFGLAHLAGGAISPLAGKIGRGVGAVAGKQAGKLAQGATRLSGSLVGFTAPTAGLSVAEGMLTPGSAVADTILSGPEFIGSAIFHDLPEAAQNATRFFADGFSPDALDALRENLTPLALLALPHAQSMLGNRTLKAEINKAYKEFGSQGVQAVLNTLPPEVHDSLTDYARNYIETQVKAIDPASYDVLLSTLPAGRLSRSEFGGDVEAQRYLEETGSVQPTQGASLPPNEVSRDPRAPIAIEPEVKSDLVEPARVEDVPRPGQFRPETVQAEIADRQSELQASRKREEKRGQKASAVFTGALDEAKQAERARVTREQFERRKREREDVRREKAKRTDIQARLKGGSPVYEELLRRAGANNYKNILVSKNEQPHIEAVQSELRRDGISTTAVTENGKTKIRVDKPSTDRPKPTVEPQEATADAAPQPVEPDVRQGVVQREERQDADAGQPVKDRGQGRGTDAGAQEQVGADRKRVSEEPVQEQVEVASTPSGAAETAPKERPTSLEEGEAPGRTGTEAPPQPSPEPQYKVEEAEIRPYRRPDGSIGYEAVPTAKEEPAAAPEPKAERVVPTEPVVLESIESPSVAAERISKQYAGQWFNFDPPVNGVKRGRIEENVGNDADRGRVKVRLPGGGFATIDAKLLDKSIKPPKGETDEPGPGRVEKTPDETTEPVRSGAGEQPAVEGEARLPGRAGAKPPKEPAEESRRPTGPPARKGEQRAEPDSPPDSPGEDTGGGGGGGAGVRSGPKRRGPTGGGERKQPEPGRREEAGAISAEPRDRPSDVSDRNHRIGPADSLASGGPKARIDSNLKAVELLKKLEAEERNPSPEEKAVLSQYVGWGDTRIAQAFNPVHAQRWESSNFGAYGWNLTEATTSWAKKWYDTHKRLRESLGEEEFNAAMQSTINAHYTSKEVISGALWPVAERLGFKGGRALENSAGVGHVIGLTPEGVEGKTEWTAVELDSLSSRILQKLYPEASVQNTGFEKARIPSNSQDLVIGNVPFARQGPKYDRNRYPRDLSLHNFFLARSIDVAKPGGLIVEITSSSTMDAPRSRVFREWASQRADLVGAIRLPNNAFKDNAGTEVTTDIIILRKKDGSAFSSPEGWLESLPIEGDKSAEGLPLQVNEYFARHPEMMLGKMTWGGTMNRGQGQEMTLSPIEGELPAMIAKAIESLPENVIGRRGRVAEEPSNAGAAERGQKEFSHVIKDGKVWQVRDGVLQEPLNPIPKNALNRAKEWIGLREATRELVLRQLDADATDAQLDVMRKKLKSKYDAYIKAHGPVTDRPSKIFKTDAEFGLVEGLEVLKTVPQTLPDGKVEFVQEATPSDIFTKRTASPPSEPTKADSVEDAAVISEQYRGKLDVDFVAELTGKRREDVAKELIDSGVSFEDPDSGLLVAREEYLSGNVRLKLRIAKEQVSQGREDLARNVKELEAVQPETIPIGSSAVVARLGATWIPGEAMAEWIGELYDGRASAVVTRVQEADSWVVNWSRLPPRDLDESLGTIDVHASDIIEKTMNMKDVKVTRTEGSGKDKVTYVDEGATLAARAAQAKIMDRFNKWIKTGPRATEMEDSYNTTFNSNVLRKYEPPTKFKNYPGANPDITLRPHQFSGVERAKRESTLMGHAVGTGKTFVAATTAMEWKRIGTAKKTLIAAQNATLNQFARDVRKLYPQAKMLVVSREDLSKDKRRVTYGRIATGDWDVVIMPHSQVVRIPDDSARVEAYIRQREEAIIDYIAALGGDVNQLLENSRGADPTVKDLVRALKGLRTRLEKMSDRQTDDVLTFEQMGIDGLIVDEAHEFKKLEFSSKMPNIKGLDRSFSQRGFTLFMKMRNVQEKTGGRNTVTMTGTLITNTLAEAWNMIRYVRPDLLEQYGVSNFDSFAAAFTQPVTNTVMSALGRWKEETRLKEFVNTASLIQMFRSAADIVTRDDANLEIPQLKDGRPRVITLPRSEDVGTYMQYLIDRLETFKKMTGRKKRENSSEPLVVHGLAKKAALDMRLINPDAKDDPGSKTNRAVDEIEQIWKDTTEFRGTQVVFADIFRSTKQEIEHQKDKAPNKVDADEQLLDDAEAAELKEEEAIAASTRFNVFEDIKKKLVARGIPESEIAIIHDYKTDAAKFKLFHQVNNGEVRVVMGTTPKLGVGVNIQTRLAALHHLDAPDRPSDVEQREGRILRQGNMLVESGIPIEILRYGVVQTFDAGQFQRLSDKQNFINQLLAGRVKGGDKITDPGSETIASFQEAMADVSGDPLVRKKIEADMLMRQLEALEETYHTDQSRQRTRIVRAKEDIKSNEKLIERSKAAEVDAKAFAGHESPTIEYQGKKYSGETVKDMEKIVDDAKLAVEEEFRKTPSLSVFGKREIGTATINGVEVKLTAAIAIDAKTGFVPPKASNKFSPAEVWWDMTKFGGFGGSGASLRGVMQSMRYKFNNLASDAAAMETSNQRNRNTIAAAEQALKTPFEQATQLEEVRAERARILAELEAKDATHAREQQGDNLPPDPRDDSGGTVLYGGLLFTPAIFKMIRDTTRVAGNLWARIAPQSGVQSTKTLEGLASSEGPKQLSTLLKMQSDVEADIGGPLHLRLNDLMRQVRGSKERENLWLAADGRAEPLNGRVKRALESLNEFEQMKAELARNAGMVFDDGTPWQPRARHMPQVFNKEARRDMRRRRGAFWDKAVEVVADHLSANGLTFDGKKMGKAGKTPRSRETVVEQAVKWLEKNRTRITDKTPDLDVFGDRAPKDIKTRTSPGVQLHRLIQWPREFLEKDLAQSAVKHTNEFIRKVSEAMVFGPRSERLQAVAKGALGEIVKENFGSGVEDAVAKNKFAKYFIETLIGRQLGIEALDAPTQATRPGARRALRAAQQLSSIVHLGPLSPFSLGVNSIWGTAMSMYRFGVVRAALRTAENLPIAALDVPIAGRLVRQHPSLRKARDVGALEHQGVEFLLSEMPWRPAVKAVLSGFVRGQEAMLRSTAAQAGVSWSNAALRGLSRRAKRAEKRGRSVGDAVSNTRAFRQLEQMGLSSAEIIAAAKSGLWSDAQVRRIARGGVAISQFLARPIDLPLNWSSPKGRFFTQFWSMAYKQTQNTVGDALNEMGHGNLVPIVRLLVLATASGWSVNQLRNALYGNRDDEEARSKLSTWLNHVSGGLGIIDRPLQVFTTNSRVADTMQRLLTPVAVSDAIKLVDAAATISRELMDQAAGIEDARPWKGVQKALRIGGGTKVFDKWLVSKGIGQPAGWQRKAPYTPNSDLWYKHLRKLEKKLEVAKDELKAKGKVSEQNRMTRGELDRLIEMRKMRSRLGTWRKQAKEAGKADVFDKGERRYYDNEVSRMKLGADK